MDISGISPPGVNPHAVRSVIAFTALSVITALATTIIAVLVSQGIPPSFPLSTNTILIAGLTSTVVFIAITVAVRVLGYSVEENKGKKANPEQEEAEKKKQAELQEKEAEAAKMKAKIAETKNDADKKIAEAEAEKATKEAEKTKAELEKMKAEAKAKADKKREKADKKKLEEDSKNAEIAKLRAEAEKLKKEKQDAEETAKKAEDARKKAEEDAKKPSGKGISHLNPDGKGNTGAAGTTGDGKKFDVEEGKKKDPLKKKS